MRLRLKICGDNKIITNKANLLQGQYKFYNKLAKLKKKKHSSCMQYFGHFLNWEDLNIDLEYTLLIKILRAVEKL